MLNYFGKYLQQRAIFLGLIFLGIRLLYAWFGMPNTVLQVIWKQTGMAIFNGNILYNGIYTDVAPLPAGIYALLEFTGSWEPLISFVLALLLMGWQAYSFNQASINLGWFVNKNYIPGMVYLLLGNSCFQLALLSPELMATTFLIGMLSRVTSHIKDPISTDEILSIGFLVSLATLCYPPAALFIVVPLAAFLLYTGTSFRQYILVGLGFAIPIALVLLGYYMLGMSADVYHEFILSVIEVSDLYLISVLTLVSLLLLPAVLLIFGFISTLQAGTYINYQRRVQIVFLLYFIICLPVVLLGNIRWAGQYLFFLPVATLFITNFFTLLKRDFVAEISFTASALLMLTFGYLSMTGYGTISRLADFSAEIVRPTPLAGLNKRILVFGTDYSYYQGNILATPYLNTDLSRRVFGQTDSYSTVLNLYNSFSENPPEVIIGADSMFTKLFDRMPALARKYKKEPSGNVYLLVKRL